MVAGSGDPARPADLTMIGNLVYSAFPATAAWIDRQLGYDADTKSAAKRRVAGDDAATVAAAGFLDSLQRTVNTDAVPNQAAATAYAVPLIAAGIVERLTGLPATYLTQSIQYAFNAANPQLIPEQAEVDALWATSRITSEQWKCFTLAHGIHPYWQQKVADMRVQRADAAQLVELLNRGAIGLKEFYDRAAAIGWKDTAEVEDLRTLAQFVPGPADLVRYMKRDVADEDVVKKYQYDKDFTDKFTGPIQQWAASQGMTSDVFKFEWRAHWEIPSPTQLREMLSRCREDRPEVTEWKKAFDAWQAAGAQGDPPAPPVIVRPSDVQTALEVNDRAPTWVPPTMKVMYRPITNSDAIRAYILGSFDESKLYHVFRDNEYSDEDAKTLVEYWKSQAVQRVANASGVLTQRSISKLYKDGAIDRITADVWLRPLMPNPAQRTEMLDRLDDQIVAETKSERIKFIHAQYMHAAYSLPDAIIALTNAGAEPIVVQRLAAKWQYELEHKSKDVTAATLCKWHGLGMIDAAEYERRLLILGYSPADAGRMVAACEIDTIVRMQKAAVAAYKQSKKQWDDAIKVLIAIDPSLQPTLGPLIGQPPKPPSGSGSGSQGKPPKG